MQTRVFENQQQVDELLVTKSQCVPTRLVVFSSLIGALLFFSNPNLTSFFSSNAAGDEWYAVFSQSIFSPNYSYIAESILLPLLAKVVGANSTGLTYRLLCAAITLMLLPSLAIALWRVFNDITRTLISVLIIALSFRYLWTYQLGFPDPLTILLLMLAATRRDPAPIFLAIFLAALSHFSMSAVGGLALIIAFFCSPEGFQNKQQQLRAIKSIFIGLVAGRAFLAIWYFLFDYSLNTRVAIVYESGLGYFFDRYRLAISDFWFTPGINFLLVCLIIFCYFIHSKAYRQAIGLTSALVLAYIALFFTTDGLRVFAVVIAASYVWIIQMFILSIMRGRLSALWESHSMAKLECFKRKVQPFYLALGLIIAIGWCVVLYKAKSKGLFINSSLLMSNLMGNSIRVFDVGMFGLSTLIFLTIAVSSFRTNLTTTFLIKILFIAPLLFVIMQFIRQTIAPNEVLSPSILIISITIIFSLAMVFARIRVCLRPEELRSTALGLLRW
jgi:hypothetical protein